MLNKIFQYEEDMYAKFWLVPAVMSLIAVGLAFLMIFLDTSLNFEGVKTFFSYFLAAKSGREALSIITGASITITSVTFSMTILTLSMASNQLGPRLLPNFIRKKSTQVVIGFFIGTFVYCLIILQSLSLANQGDDFSYLSITFGLLLGITSFFLLIYFIHFVCDVIQIDNVLKFLVGELIACIDRQCPDRQKAKEHTQDLKLSATKTEAIAYRDTQFNYCSDVICAGFGYIQTIDYEKLFELANRHGIQIHVKFGIGQFVFKGLAIMEISSDILIDDHIKHSCLNAMLLGNRRSTVQDIEFAFEQISEIAIRAMSPGVNNPYTAVHCLDRIAQSFAALAKKRMPSPILFNERGEVLIIRKIARYKDIVGTAFNRLRQQAQFDLSVAIHVLNMIERLFTIDMTNELKNALSEQAITIYQDASRKEMSDFDRNDLDHFYQKVQQAIAD